MSLKKVSSKLLKTCPPPGMLVPPCASDAKMGKKEKAAIMKEFTGLIPVDKLEEALEYSITNHAEAARRANWIMRSIRDKEFMGASPKKGTRKRIQHGGTPDWIKNKICTLIIMLAVGGTFWAIWPTLEAYLINWGILPVLCSVNFFEHLGVMFGNQGTFGAVLTCKQRDEQYRATITAMIAALGGAGGLTREAVRNNYNETHTWIKAKLFGAGGWLATPPEQWDQLSPLSASPATPSMHSASVGSHTPLSGSRSSGRGTKRKRKRKRKIRSRRRSTLTRHRRRRHRTKRH